MTTKHTPGPWCPCPTDTRPEEFWVRHYNNLGQFEALAKIVKPYSMNPDEAGANARLIAAAPTLLDELGAVLSAMVVVDLRLDVEKKQSDEQGTDVYILAGAHQQIKERIKAARAAIEKAIG